MSKGLFRVAAAATFALLSAAGVIAVVGSSASPEMAHAEPAADEVSGKITVAETGAAVVGAEVQLWARPADAPLPPGAAALAELNDPEFAPVPDLSWPAAPLQRAFTNAEGGYRIPAAPPGTRAWVVVVAQGRAMAMRVLSDAEGDVAIPPTVVTQVRVVGVTSGGDKPIPGADVRVFPLGLSAPQAVRLTTGADGTVRIALAGTATLLVSASGYTTEAVSPEPGTDAVAVVRLGAGGAVSGTVVDEAGAPVVGATVLETNGYRSIAAVTGEGGVFRLTGVSRSGRRGRLVAVARGFAASRARVTGGDPPLRIMLAPPRTVEGRVRAPDGKPCAGCTVSIAAAGQPHTTTTGPDGSFTIIDMPSERLTLSASRSRGGEQDTAYYTLDLRPGAANPPVDVRLNSGRNASVLRARIVDEARKPIAGAVVQIQFVSPELRAVQTTVKTGAEGEIEQALPVRPGFNAILTISPGIKRLDAVGTSCATSEFGTQPKEIVLAALTTVTLDVRGDDGAVIPPAKWTAQWVPMPAAPTDLLFPAQCVAAEGAMRVPANIPFELMVASKGRALYAARRTAAEAKDGVLTVQTVKATTVRIPVVTSDAAGPVVAMSGTAIRLDSDLVAPLSVTLRQDDGGVVADGVGPGRWVAYVIVRDRTSRASVAERRFEGLAPGTKELPAVKVPTSRVTGTVRSAGAPLPLVEVRQVIPRVGDVGAMTDENGRFDMAALPGPGCRVRIVRDGFATIEAPWPAAGQKLDFTMVPAASITIRRHRQTIDDRSTLTIRNAGREFDSDARETNDSVFLDDLTPGPVEIIETAGAFRRVTRGEVLRDKIVEFDLPPR